MKKQLFALLALSLTFTAAAHAQIPVVEYEVGPNPIITKTGARGATLEDAEPFDGSAWPEGYIAITIDDGPNKTYTEKVLDILKQYQIRATFFMVGTVAERYPAIAKKVLAAGHTVGTHTLDHKKYLGSTPKEDALVEVREGIRVIGDALGTPPAPLFRFPFLSSNAENRVAVAQEGLAYISWGRMLDGKGIQLGSSLKPQNGHLQKGVLITHDTHDSILWALPSFLDQMEKYGYTAVVLVPSK